MTSTLILYILRAVASLVLPAAAFVYVRTKFSGKLRNFFDGAAVYIIFYCLIYAVVSTYLEMFTNIFESVNDSYMRVLVNIILETLCVALGYLIWFKAAVKKQQDNGVGLMTGVGFSSLLLIVSHTIPSVVNVVISAMYMKNPEANVSAVFEGNIYQVSSATPLSLFLDLLEMIFLFALETAIAATFYRVLRCENRKIWLLAAMILRMGAYVAVSLTDMLERAVTVIIFGAITVVAAGMIYSLITTVVCRNAE